MGEAYKALIPVRENAPMCLIGRRKEVRSNALGAGQLAFCSDIICGREGEFLGVHAGCTVTDGGVWNPSEKGMGGSIAQIQRLKKAIYLNSELYCYYYRYQSQRLICYFNLNA